MPFFKKERRRKKKDNSTFTAVVCIILSLAIIKYKSLLEESFPNCAANIQVCFTGSQDVFLLRSVVRRTFYILGKGFLLEEFYLLNDNEGIVPFLILKCLSNFKMHI